MTASASVADRRDSNASKTVVTREDFARFGDATISAALQRVPGISIVQAPGKDPEIRMRGLGGGYTQILLNGEPVPAGFSIEALNPSLIDHIDVLRSATADMSTQAIAGTINIVLKRPTSAPASAKIAFSETNGRPAANGSFDSSGTRGGLTWAIGLSGGLTRDDWPSRSVTTGEGDGTPAYAFTTATKETDKQLVAAMAPQAALALSGGGSLSLNALLQGRHVVYDDTDRRDALSGAGFDFASDAFTSTDDSRLGRVSLKWKSRRDSDARGETGITLSSNSRVIDAQFEGRDIGDQPMLNRTVHSTLSDDSALGSGKGQFALGEAHTLGVGWDGQAGRRKEHRIQNESSQTGFPTTDLDEDYTAQVSRLALFAQDEWQATRNTSVYAGLRWEALHTRVSGNDLQPTGESSSVLSPTLQAIWKIPDTKSDQIRLSFGRTYKAPTSRDLVPRLWVVSENSATTPDFRGNPALKPELSWGTDVSYERYLADGALLSFSGFGRRIDDVVIQQIYDDAGTWIQSPTNATRAQVYGMAFEAKGQLRNLIVGTDVPNVDIRFGATRNWSHVDGVPAPGSRLTQQPPYTLTAGADWHCKGVPLTLGSSFVLERGGYARVSQTESVNQTNKRLLDLYALWKVDKQSQLRVAVTNALALHSTTTTTYEDSTFEESTANTSSNAATVKVQYETRF